MKNLSVKSKVVFCGINLLLQMHFVEQNFRRVMVIVDCQNFKQSQGQIKTRKALCTCTSPESIGL